MFDYFLISYFFSPAFPGGHSNFSSQLELPRYRMDCCQVVRGEFKSLLRRCAGAYGIFNDGAMLWSVGGKKKAKIVRKE